MADTVHFSVLMRRALCGKVSLHYTAVPDNMTCERCKQLLAKTSATEADLWALEAAEDLKKLKEKSALNVAHVTGLFAYSIERRKLEVKKAKQRVENEEDELKRMESYALDFGIEAVRLRIEAVNVKDSA